MFIKRQEWASLLGIYALGAFMYTLLLTPGFSFSGLQAGMSFMFIGLVLGLCGGIIGRRSGRTITGIIGGYFLFILMLAYNYWTAA
jgi:hypothetical protein